MPHSVMFLPGFVMLIAGFLFCLLSSLNSIVLTSCGIDRGKSIECPYFSVCVYRIFCKPRDLHISNISTHCPEDLTDFRTGLHSRCITSTDRPFVKCYKMSSHITPSSFTAQCVIISRSARCLCPTCSNKNLKSLRQLVSEARQLSQPILSRRRYAQQNSTFIKGALK